MKKARKILLSEFFVIVSLLLLIILIFESGFILPGSIIGGQSLFIVQFIMQLLTLLLVPFSLYLFRLSVIKKALFADNSPGKRSLCLWGTVRMLIIAIPMLINMIFYYLYGKDSSFFYLSIILFLCILFFYPSNKRCHQETTCFKVVNNDTMEE